MRSMRLLPLLFLAALALAFIPTAAQAQAPEAAAAPTVDTAQAGPCAPAALAAAVATPTDDKTPACGAADPLAAAGLLLEPIAQQGPPNRRRFCRCGCGVTCETDADCGPGGSCVAFITCC